MAKSRQNSTSPFLVKPQLTVLRKRLRRLCTLTVIAALSPANCPFFSPIFRCLEPQQTLAYKLPQKIIPEHKCKVVITSERLIALLLFFPRLPRRDSKIPITSSKLFPLKNEANICDSKKRKEEDEVYNTKVSGGSAAERT